MWKWACLVPHPPIIVPEVGRGKEKEAIRTIQGMTSLTQQLEEKKPDVLFILSPHAPYSRGLLFVESSEYKGDLSLFGVPEVSLHAKGNHEKFEAIYNFLKEIVPVEVMKKATGSLDHASIVPLYFFHKQWGNLPDIILANPIGLTLEEASKMGKELRQFQDTLQWGLIASGDLSHRVIPGAPAGYSPLGAFFDEQVVRALKTSDAQLLLNLPESTIEEAGECGLRSVLIYLGIAEPHSKMISYEAPFGVGYAVAIATPQKKEYPLFARNVIEEYIQNDRQPAQREIELWSPLEALHKKGACFVSLKTKDGHLRGCIGTILPVHQTLSEELVANAIAAATEDPRFLPVQPDELKNIVVSVDILSEPEEVHSIDELDVKIYGIIVSNGVRKGVLLPDLDGVDTVERQIHIALQKAGISSHDNITIYRFTVDRYLERGE